ncbi:hypothetical protein J21TS3_45010 [Paenibacillus cookii]|uniref:Uncharacterized protein n=1 Tax=Paenibacillus cookii TaxID=157839 RepID=A0ABQ4M2B1_9BACL|nr:hypothetical protein J21TS3_45010 [Paenibacillus cookii]
MLANFGIEGTHYTIQSKVQQWLLNVKKQFDNNPDLKWDAGPDVLSAIRQKRLNS